MKGARGAVLRRAALDGRARTLAFAALFALAALANVRGYEATYPTLAARVKFVNTFADNKATRLFYGVPHNLVTTGGYVAWRVGGLLSVFAALFGVFAAVRALRAEEENGRAELVLAGALTRTSTFTAAMGAVALSILAIGVALYAGLAAGGLASGGAAYLALTTTMPAVVYAGVGALASQVMPTRRGALEAAGGVLAIDFLVRVAADTVDVRWPHFVAPLGWVEEGRAFSGTHAVMLLPPIAAAAVLVGVSSWLFHRRDLGAGFVAPHDTAPPRPFGLGSPTALAFRLERVSLATWTFGVAAFAIVIGSVAKTVSDIGISEDLRRQFEKFGGIDIASPTGYIGLTFVFFVFAIGLFACAQLAAARDEESEHRLETLFALPYGRTRWLSGRLLLALAAIAVLALSAGLGIGIGALATGTHLSFVHLLEASVNCLPTAVLILGLGALLLQLQPRHGVGLTYLFVAAAFMWELFGALLNAPRWTLDLSPFHHLAPAPAKPIAALSALVMTAIGVLAAGAALARHRTRDLVGD